MDDANAHARLRAPEPSVAAALAPRTTELRKVRDRATRRSNGDTLLPVWLATGVTGLASMELSGQIVERIFDQLPNVVFFVKDVLGRYTAVNSTLVERIGKVGKSGILNRTAREVFPDPFGAAHAAQDELVLRTGVEVRDQLELHLYPGGKRGWCSTFKAPLRGKDGAIQGLLGISRDLHDVDECPREYVGLAQAVQEIRERHAQPIKFDAIARRAGLSPYMFDRLVFRTFHITPRQLLVRARIEAAVRLLETEDRSIADVAQKCGYADHSAFARQFRATTGLSPRELRQAAASRFDVVDRWMGERMTLFGE